MLKRYLICMLMIFLLANSLANANSIHKKTTESLNIPIQALSANNSEEAILADAIFSPLLENELWIKTKFGEDFHRFYTNKIKNKKRKPNTLKMDFNLGYLSKATTKTDQSHKTYVEINKARIQSLDLPEIQFSDESYPWNAANVSIVKLGSDYQQYVTDEISAEHTYKEFWDGEETTEFEDFIDEHFGFHDSALIRYLILLVGIFFVVVGYILKPTIIGYMQSND